MKVIEYSEKESRAAQGAKPAGGQGLAGLASGLMNQVNKFMGVESKDQASEAIIPLLKRVLDDSFTLHTNHPLPDYGLSVPMILIGPPGVYVLYPCGLRGTYQAKGETWYELNEGTQSFDPARDNLVGDTANLGLAVVDFLQGEGVKLPELDAAILFSEPGVHVDTARPVVRIVMSDAIGKFAAGLAQGTIRLSRDDVYNISALFTRAAARAVPQPVIEAAVSTPPPSRAPALTLPTFSLPKVKFATWQWVVLGGLFLLLCMVAFIFMVLFLASL